MKPITKAERRFAIRLLDTAVNRGISRYPTMGWTSVNLGALQQQELWKLVVEASHVSSRAKVRKNVKG